jgi:hypothetical protein
MSRHAVLQAYRQLLRAEHTVFGADVKAKVGHSLCYFLDRLQLILKTVLQTAALKKTRETFLANGSESSPEKIAKLVEQAQQTAHFIRSSLVQAKLNKRDSYGMNALIGVRFAHLFVISDLCWDRAGLATRTPCSTIKGRSEKVLQLKTVVDADKKVFCFSCLCGCLKNPKRPSGRWSAARARSMRSARGATASTGAGLC